MIIVKNGTVEMSDSDRARMEPAYLVEDTLEIQDAEWDEIFDGYDSYKNKILCKNLAFRGTSTPAESILYPSQYLKELIALKEARNE